jgi:NMD protein affecting ribosome stability and mRNA decay
MSTTQQRGTVHQHTAVEKHALGQRAGVPYEIVQTVCTQCLRVLGERPLRRAAA